MSAPEFEPASALGNLSTDSSNKQLKSVISETVSVDTKISNFEETSSNNYNDTSYIQRKDSAVLERVEVINNEKLEDMTLKATVDNSKPLDNKDAVDSENSTSGLSGTSETRAHLNKQLFKLQDLFAQRSKNKKFVSETKSDSINSTLNKDSSSKTVFSSESAPIDTTGKTNIVPEMSLGSSSEEFKGLPSEESVKRANLTNTNKSASKNSDFNTGLTTTLSNGNQDVNYFEISPHSRENYPSGIASGYSDSNSEKDSMFEMKYNFKEFSCAEKLATTFSPGTFLTSETSFNCSVKATEKRDSGYNSGFKLAPTSSREKPAFASGNPIVSSAKQLENPSSASVTKCIYPDVNQETNYAGLNSESVQNLSRIKSVTTVEDSSDKNTVNIAGFKFAITDNDSTSSKDLTSKTGGFKFTVNDTDSTTSKDLTCKTEGFKFGVNDTNSITPKNITSKSEGIKFGGLKFTFNDTDSTIYKSNTFKTEFTPTMSSKANPCTTLKDAPGTGAVKFEKPSSNSDTHEKENITSNLEFSFGLKALSASTEKKLGNLSAQSIAECSKFDLNRSTNSCEDSKLGSTPSASGEQSNTAHIILHPVEIKNFTASISVDGAKPTFSKDNTLNKEVSFGSNIGFSKAKGTATMENLFVPSSEKYGNFSFGTSDNETKSATDTKSITATGFSFHSTSSTSNYESRPFLKKPPRHRKPIGSTFEAPSTSKTLEGFTFGNTSGFSFGSVNNNNVSVFTFGSSKSFPSGPVNNNVPAFGLGNPNSLSFGSLNSKQEPKAVQGTRFKFIPPTGFDKETKRGKLKYISTKHQYITAMRQYLNKSFEELRFEDYKQMGRVWNTLQYGGLFFPNSRTDFANTNTTGINTLLGGTESKGVSELLKGLEELLISGNHSDVTVNVQDKKFSVHKVILAIRSPVFSAMMEHETKEKATGVVNIPDCEPGPFFDFLHFLYTGSTRKLTAENVLDLYIIADKYQVSELCKICVNYMKNGISVQNFCDILSLALRYHEKELIDVGTHFFVEYSTEITVTVEWGLFVKKNPVAANELFIKALKTYKK